MLLRSLERLHGTRRGYSAFYLVFWEFQSRFFDFQHVCRPFAIFQNRNQNLNKVSHSFYTFSLTFFRFSLTFFVIAIEILEILQKEKEFLRKSSDFQKMEIFEFVLGVVGEGESVRGAYGF